MQILDPLGSSFRSSSLHPRASARPRVARAALLLLPSLLLPIPFAADAAAGHLSRVTLQVRDEPGYSARDVEAFLSRDAYLGSIQAGLTSRGSLAPDAVLPQGVVTLQAVSPGGEILCLELQANDRDALVRATEGVLAHLKSIVPSHRGDTVALIEAATTQFQEASEALEEAKARMRGFVEQHGAMQPSTALSLARNELQSRRSDLGSQDELVATLLASRDFLAEAASSEPAVIVEQQPADPRVVKALEDRVLEATLELNEERLRATDEHAKVQAARDRVVKASAALEEARKATVRRERANPRRMDLETELFNVERELVRHQSRQKYLAETVARLEAEAKRLALLEAEWDSLRGDVDDARLRLQNARNSLANAEQMRRNTSGTWIQVIAGPQYSA